MFSDPARTPDEIPAKALFMIAAGLVIICQLVAMALVATSQVEKAQWREASLASASAATAACFERSTGATLQDCAATPAALSTQARAVEASLKPPGVSQVAFSENY